MWNNIVESFINDVGSFLFRKGEVSVQYNHYDSTPAVISGGVSVNTDVGVGDLRMKIIVDKGSWHISPPSVITEAAWLCPSGPSSKELYLDWHRYPTGELCWIRPDDWHKATNGMKDVLDARCAAATLSKNVETLLRYHFIGYTFGLVTWPKEWEFRPHGSYERKLKRRVVCGCKSTHSFA